MQKKLIALAVAGLVSAPVFAQSNVTIYGSADAGLIYGKSGEMKANGIANGVLSGNRLGFKGSEDLGNGLKALFQLEQGYSIGDGAFHQSSRQFSRQAWVGLQGAFGTVGLGRQYAPGYAYSATYDGLLGTNLSPQSILSLGAGNTITPNSAARWNNSVRFQSNNYSGFTGEAIYSFNDVQTNAFGQMSSDDKYGLGLSYANGPLSAGYVFQVVKSATDKQKEHYVGAMYDFKVVKLAASWQNKKVDVAPTGNKIYTLGLIVPVGTAGNVHASYGKLDAKDVSDADSKGFALAYTHALSKRTTAYVGYSWLKNEDNVAIAMLGSVAEAGEKANTVTAGVNHKF